MSCTQSFPDGVYTVLVTPFNDDFTVNYKNLKLWTEMQMDNPIAGLVLLGTTSEVPTLSQDEQFNIVQFVSDLLKASKSDKFLCVGVGGNDTERTRQFAVKCADLCDGFMVTVPSYNVPPQEGIIEHYAHICNDPVIAAKPVILYNVPKRTGVNAEPETIKMIADRCPNLKAVKEASGSMKQIVSIRELCPELKVFSGDDKMIVDVMGVGGKGVISVASNAYPDIVCSVYDKCVQNIDDGKDMFESVKMGDLCDALFCQSNPIPIKYCLYRLGLFDTCQLRLPMVPLREDKRKMVDDVMAFYAV